MSHRNDGRALIAIGVLGIIAWWLTPKFISTASVGPLRPVGPIGNTDPNAGSSQGLAVSKLCLAAPINSFGAQCEGISWRYVTGVPTDLRVAPIPVDSPAYDTPVVTAPSPEVLYGPQPIGVDGNGQTVYA